MKKVWYKYLKLFFLLLYVGYYGGISLFLHVHIENGVTIVHSHPFHDSESSSHHHTLAELQLINTVSSVMIEDGAVHVLDIPRFFSYVTTLPIAHSLGVLISQFFDAYNLRAPPFFLFK